FSSPNRESDCDKTLPESHLSAHIRRSKLHHGSTDNLSSSHQVEIFVELLELEDFEGVANLALSGQRHDLSQVEVIAPERAMKGLFTRNPREQRDVDAVAHHSHIAIVSADREQAEGQLDHLGSTRAVHDGIQVTLASDLAKFLGNIG